MVVVTQTDRPKSVRNRFVIELFVALFVLPLCFFDRSKSARNHCVIKFLVAFLYCHFALSDNDVGKRDFVIKLSHILLAYSSGHLVLSHLGLAFVLMLRPFFPELVMSTDLLSFEHPSVLLFCSSFFFCIMQVCHIPSSTTMKIKTSQTCKMMSVPFVYTTFAVSGPQSVWSRICCCVFVLSLCFLEFSFV